MSSFENAFSISRRSVAVILSKWFWGPVFPGRSSRARSQGDLSREPWPNKELANPVVREGRREPP